MIGNYFPMDSSLVGSATPASLRVLSTASCENKNLTLFDWHFTSFSALVFLMCFCPLPSDFVPVFIHLVQAANVLRKLVHELPDGNFPLEQLSHPERIVLQIAATDEGTANHHHHQHYHHHAQLHFFKRY